MMNRRGLLAATTLAGLSISASAAPAGFPASGNGMWYNTAGGTWGRTYLLYGNGYLGASSNGAAQSDTTYLNIDTLWSGGPFADSTYNGGNQPASNAATMAKDLATIRQTIFSSGTVGNVEQLAVAPGAYGSFTSPGTLVATLTNPSSGTISNYGRFLDLDAGKIRSTWTQSNATFTREAFCSHPSQACVQYTTTTGASFSQTYKINSFSALPAPSGTCQDSSTIRYTGLAANPGMAFEILANVRTTGGTVSCSASGGLATITVTDTKESWITWVGGTEYDLDAGDSAHNFSYKGADPHNALNTLLTATNSSSYSALLSQHNADYVATVGKFKLDLGQKPDLTTPTDTLKNNYVAVKGNPYLEWVTFNFGRYLLASSARGVLPTNLQGKWSNAASVEWGADYHSNINIQMNYWSAEPTNLDVTQSLWNYIQKNWATRGAQTASTLYGVKRGWVTHNEMNIFGHTGMKLRGNSASYADYTDAHTWFMIHAWDHFDYSQDVNWWKTQGYPLLKGVTEFKLDQLVTDNYFKDGSLVIAPCNSPEQGYISFGCAHQQQMIWQLFNAAVKGYSAAGDTDTAFLSEVQTALTKIDKGIRIGSWGQLQEWKIDRDSETDTHRHLSHLIGLYPGYAISGYNSAVQGPVPVNGTNKTYTQGQVVNAAQTSLIARGNGTGPDADAGWEKAWRAACWAQLRNSTQFYLELTYTIQRDFAVNLMSMYEPTASNPVFQIDANLGYPGALINALFNSKDVPNVSSPLVVEILPALPSAWPNGSIKAARVRGGITMDLTWSGGKPTTATFTVDPTVISRKVQVVYNGATKATFTSTGGSTTTVTNWA